MIFVALSCDALWTSLAGACVVGVQSAGAGAPAVLMAVGKVGLFFLQGSFLPNVYGVQPVAGTLAGTGVAFACVTSWKKSAPMTCSLALSEVQATVQKACPWGLDRILGQKRKEGKSPSPTLPLGSTDTRGLRLCHSQLCTQSK